MGADSGVRKTELVPSAVAIPQTDDRRALVVRVAASPHFQKSPKLREFLLYVCEKALANQPEQINEQFIGCRVFGRRPDYNSNEDNIVRVEARQLRRRLADYFDKEGRDEPTVIEIPKGTYVPAFEPRPVAASTVTVKETAPAVVQPVRERGPRSTIIALGLAVTVLAALCIWLWKRGAPVLDPATSSLRRLLWSELFDASHQTYVVVADSCFVLLQDLTRRPVSLNEYLSRDYPRNLKQAGISSEMSAVLDLISSRQYTSLADSDLTARILHHSSPFRDRTLIRYARNLQVRDFKAANFVLLGSTRANPWVELFEPQLDFNFEVDEALRKSYLRNKSPRSGELPFYRAGGKDGTTTETYGLIALCPNLNRNGNVLIVAGTTMEGTEAAGESVTNGELFLKLLRAMGLNTDRERLPYFQALLKTSTMAGAARESGLVAYRFTER